jgi:hypothetical protein
MVSPDNPNPRAPRNRTKISNSEVSLRRMLRDAPQDLWLETIRRTRGDAHNNLIFWMLSQPECDFAIAAHAFYRSDPVFQINNPNPLSPRPGADNLFAVVLVNWDTGFFRTHNLRVETNDVHPRVMARLNDKMQDHPRGSLPFQIPKKLLDPEGGNTAVVPPHFSPDNVQHIWALYADLGLQVPDTAPGIPRRVEQAKGLLKMVGIKNK